MAQRRHGIALTIGMPIGSVRSFLRALERGKYISKFHTDERSKRIYYRIVRDTGIFPPRITSDGASAKPSSHDKMWSAAKVLKRFTYLDLALSAAVGKSIAQQYCNDLLRGRYLRRTGKFDESGKNEILALVDKNNLGPLAPQVLSDQSIYDQNTNEIVCHGGEIGAENE